MLVSVPVILPSLPPSVVGLTPCRPSGASCSARSMRHWAVAASVVPSVHLPVLEVTLTVYVPASVAMFPSMFIVSAS